MTDPNRNQTDEDAAKVADELLDRLSKRFRLEVGGGVIALAWRGLFLATVMIAVWFWAHEQSILPSSAMPPSVHP
jgi:hypothetical protein